MPGRGSVWGAGLNDALVRERKKNVGLERKFQDMRVQCEKTTMVMNDLKNIAQSLREKEEIMSEKISKMSVESEEIKMRLEMDEFEKDMLREGVNEAEKKVFEMEREVQKIHERNRFLESHEVTQMANEEMLRRWLVEQEMEKKEREKDEMRKQINCLLVEREKLYEMIKLMSYESREKEIRIPRLIEEDANPM